MSYCSICGRDNPPGEMYCDQCGERLTGVQTPPQSADATVSSFTPASSAGRSGDMGDLIVVSGVGAPRGYRFPLANQQYRIGRSAYADIVLHDPSVSAEHALIWYDRGFFYIQDEASRNGTFLEGSPVVREALRDGDEIRVGDTTLVLRVLPPERR